MELQISEMATVAAKFWSEFLKEKQIAHNIGTRNIEEVVHTANVNVLSNMLRDANRVSAEQADQFEQALAQEIERRIQEGDQYIVFGVDYHPDRELMTAAAVAGFDADTGQFPFKTQMWIHESEVSVTQGYGAPQRTLYPIK